MAKQANKEAKSVNINETVVKTEDTNVNAGVDLVTQAIRRARIEQELRIRNLLEPEIDKQIADTIKRIIFMDEFDVEGHHLKWNILSDEYNEGVQKIANGETLTDKQKKELKPVNQEDEKLKQWYKLTYDGFTDEMYVKMSAGLLKILQMAAGYRANNFFRQSG